MTTPNRAARRNRAAIARTQRRHLARQQHRAARRLSGDARMPGYAAASVVERRMVLAAYEASLE